MPALAAHRCGYRRDITADAFVEICVNVVLPVWTRSRRRRRFFPRQRTCDPIGPDNLIKPYSDRLSDDDNRVIDWLAIVIFFWMPPEDHALMAAPCSPLAKLRST